MRRNRSLAALASLLAITALVVFGAATVLAKTTTATKKGKKDSGTLYAATDRTAGGYEYISGLGTDKLFGNVAVTFKVKETSTAPGTLTVTGKQVTLYTKTGTLTGKGSATATIAPTGTITFSGGKLELTNGTGALKGHSLKGTFSGTGSVASSTATFNYTGRYR